MMFRGKIGMGAVSTADVKAKIIAEAARQGVPASIALSVAQVESGFRMDRPGAAGEIGVFQLMPATAAGLHVDPSNLDANIRGGISFLASNYSRFGNWIQALQAYNCGPACAASGKIPSSTLQYVSGVLGGQAAFSDASQGTASTGIGPETALSIDSTPSGLFFSDSPPATDSSDFLTADALSPMVLGGLAVGAVGLILLLTRR